MDTNFDLPAEHGPNTSCSAPASGGYLKDVSHVEDAPAPNFRSLKRGANRNQGASDAPGQDLTEPRSDCARGNKSAKRGKKANQHSKPVVATPSSKSVDPVAFGNRNENVDDAPIGQNPHVSQRSFAGRGNKFSGPAVGDDHNHSSADGDEQRHFMVEDQIAHALPSPLHTDDPTILRLIELHRMRRRWLKARNSLILQGKAFGRSLTGGSKEEGTALYNAVSSGSSMDLAALMCISPFVDAAGRFDADLTKAEREMVKLAKKLPIASWVEGVHGVGLGSLAALVGEAGDIGQWRTVSGLWKRMGLAVIDGERQRKVGDAEEALRQGYSPGRRSVVWNVGGSLIGGMGRGPRPFVGEDIDARQDWSSYQRMFVSRLRYEAARDPEKMGRDPVKDPKTGKMRESFSAHCAARSKRYVEKKFLRDLWAAWRRAAATSQADTYVAAPPPELIAAE